MERKLDYIINLTFLGYFIILIAERLISLISSIVNIGFAKMYSTGFGIYTNTIVIVSIAAFAVFFAIMCRDSLKKVCNLDQQVYYKNLSIASGILLVSGMVHTEYTVSGIQFASYGVLIAGIALKVILLMKNAESKSNLWLTFAYLVAFSMAIPVVYESHIESATAFHIVESITSLALVGAFTYMLVKIFEGNCKAVLNPCIFGTMVLLDAAIIAWRWKEEINYFVLIFAGVSVVLYIITKIRSSKAVKA